MPPATTSTFPGGSKSRVNRAGQAISEGKPTEEDFEVLDTWRSAHRAVLNTFQAILRIRAKGKAVTVAQRHKRKATIIDKLQRIPKMALARMDDVAGCRLIFDDLESLAAFRDSLHGAKFRHRLRNEIDKYDYIKHPKPTGYRGIHDVYEYDVNSIAGAPLKGLLIELQYRTLVQHAWATTVEVIGFITKSQPKFERGDARFTEAMAYASEILARAFEEGNGPFPHMADRAVVAAFRRLDKELRLLRMLRGVKAADTTIASGGNAILIFREDGVLEIRSYDSAPIALDDLFRLEQEYNEDDIVLVRADTSEDVRLAFKNYFSDTSDFIRLVEQGCRILAPTRIRRRTRTNRASRG